MSELRGEKRHGRRNCRACDGKRNRRGKPSAPSDDKGKENKLGIAGFVVSLISLGLGYYYAIASIVGLVLSAVAFGTRKKYDKYNGFALAGMIIGIVSTVIWVIVYIYVFIVIFALISIGGSC